MEILSEFSHEDRFLLIHEVTSITRLSKPRIYHLISERRFPEQVRLSDNRVAWMESEVLGWLTARLQERRCNQEKSPGQIPTTPSAS
ncbi:helix-turn-helix transcriptional regulator [Azospirillum canadense]|uniref:helix-turn-helix transcriptional regulator n=1 Tax=Azospirillum canadense TaxID=403962 RepID=UPI003873C040